MTPRPDLPAAPAVPAEEPSAEQVKEWAHLLSIIGNQKKLYRYVGFKFSDADSAELAAIAKALPLLIQRAHDAEARAETERLHSRESHFLSYEATVVRLEAELVARRALPSGPDEAASYIRETLSGLPWGRWCLDLGVGNLDEIKNACFDACRQVPSGGDTEALLSFVGQALTDARVEEIGDWDGGELQDALERCGIIERVHRVTPCSPAGPDGDSTCRCVEFYGQGETAECFPITALGKCAIAVYREQQDRAALSAPTREPPHREED